MFGVFETSGMTEDVASRIYFDTTIFIDAFESASAYSDQLKDIFERLTLRPKLAVTSEFTLAEVFGKVSDRGWAWQQRFYFNLIASNESLDLRPLTRAVLIGTGAFRKEAREQDRISELGDAIHAVTAIDAACRYLFTCDKRFFVPPSTPRLTTDEAGFATIRQVLDA